MDQFYWDEWVREITARGVDPAEITGAQDRMSHDIPATLDVHLAWLRDAGFADADCYYKYLGFTVFGGKS